MPVSRRSTAQTSAVSGVIVGVRHAQHLDQTIATAGFVLNAEDRADIARIQATSSGPRGDVYALERVKGGPHAAVMRYTLNRASGAAEA